MGRKPKAQALTETLLPGTVSQPAATMVPVAIRVLCQPAQRYHIGRESVTDFPNCRGQMVTAIKVFASIIEVHYANGCREDFDSAAVAVLYEKEKNDAC